MKRPIDRCANRQCGHLRSEHGLHFRSVMLATCRVCAASPYENREGDLVCACYRFVEAR